MNRAFFIELLSIIHFFVLGLMPLFGAFAFTVVFDSYNWVAAIVGFLGTIIFSAYLINHYQISKIIPIAIISIILPFALIVYECSFADQTYISFFLKSAFINLGALAIATSIPLLLISVFNIQLLPGSLILAFFGVAVIWLLNYISGYISPENAAESFKYLLIALIFETLRTALGIAKSNKLFTLSSSNKFINSILSIFRINSYKPKLLEKHHDRIMTIIGAISFVSFFILIIL